jgi:hypothetical protein
VVFPAGGSGGTSGCDGIVTDSAASVASPQRTVRRVSPVNDGDQSAELTSNIEGKVVVITLVRPAVVFAMSQPEDVDINEILFRLTRQEY